MASVALNHTLAILARQRLKGKHGWDRAGNCVRCGEAGCCQCDHSQPFPEESTTYIGDFPANAQPGFAGYTD